MPSWGSGRHLQGPRAACLDVDPHLSGMVLTPVPAIESCPSGPGSGEDLSSCPWSWALRASGMREHCPARSLGSQGQLSHRAASPAESGQRPPRKPRQALLRSTAPPLHSAPRRTHLASAPNPQTGTHVAMTPCPSWELPREAGTLGGQQRVWRPCSPRSASLWIRKGTWEAAGPPHAPTPGHLADSQPGLAEPNPLIPRLPPTQPAA